MKSLNSIGETQFIDLTNYVETIKVAQWGRQFNSHQRIKSFEKTLPSAQDIIDSVEVKE